MQESSDFKIFPLFSNLHAVEGDVIGNAPYAPSSTCQVQPPSHFPVVGSALKLQGHPQSQLQATRTFPDSFHRTIMSSPGE